MMFVESAKGRHIFHAGTGTVTEHFEAVLVDLLEELQPLEVGVALLALADDLATGVRQLRS